MNPRQRRGVILLGLSLLTAFGVFFGVLSFVSDVNARVGPLVPVVEVTAPATAYRPVTPEMLQLRQVPQKWLPAGAIGNPQDVVGRVPTSDLPAGSYAQRGMFVDRPGVAQGYREVAILVDAETGVAGKVSSGDRVDIVTTSDEKDAAAARKKKDTRRADVWVSNALIIDVGVPEDVERREGSGFSAGKAVPVTFALPIPDALKVAYAESFSVKVRLALRGGGDQTEVPPEQLSFPAVSAR
jgi:pilus assembly protein CpaB